MPARLRWAAALCLLLASAAGTAAEVVVLPEGNLLLEMGKKPLWRFGSEIQEIRTTGKCTVLTAPANLVELTGQPGGAGLLNTNNKKLLGTTGPGVSCGRISTGGSLSIALAGTLAEKVISTADIALNAKFNAVVRADVYQGETRVATFRLYTGKSIPKKLAANEAACAAGADSGPDNAATNCRWAFAATGNRLVIKAEKGEVGIGGLGSTSTFQIGRAIPATGQLDCGEETEVVPFDNTDEGTNAFVQCRRLDNIGEPPASCDVVNYSLTASCEGNGGDCGVSLFHGNEPDDPLNSAKFAFICETWWPEQNGTFVNGSLDLPKTQQFFGPNELRGTDLDFCAGVTPVLDPNVTCTFESGGTVGNCPASAIEEVLVPPGLDHQTQIPGQQLGCLLDQRVHQVEDLEKSVIDVLLKLFQQWYLQGDYTALRGLR
ncbi:MAG TPA: hypothetical protein VF210_05550 [Pseudomonadales bacterium]